MTDALDQGRRAFASQQWADAYMQLSAADESEPLEPDDLARMAVAANLIGEDDVSADVWERAHQSCLRKADPIRAARCAFWLGLALVLRGDMARGNGWLIRAQRLVDDTGVDCVERGLLLVVCGLEALEGGDAASALQSFDAAGEIGKRFGDPDLMTFWSTRSGPVPDCAGPGCRGNRHAG